MEQKKITAELAQTVLSLGTVVINASPPSTDDQHVEGFKRIVRSTRINHEVGEETVAFGLGLSKFPPLQVAYVGNSPNSEAVARALQEAWNRFVEDCEEWKDQQDIAESRRNEQSA